MSSPASPTKVTRSFFFRSHRFLVSYRRQKGNTRWNQTNTFRFSLHCRNTCCRNLCTPWMGKSCSTWSVWCGVILGDTPWQYCVVISARVLLVRVYSTDWEFVKPLCICFVELLCDCSYGALLEMLKKSGVSGPLLWVIWLLYSTSESFALLTISQQMLPFVSNSFWTQMVRAVPSPGWERAQECRDLVDEWVKNEAGNWQTSGCGVCWDADAICSGKERYVQSGWFTGPSTLLPTSMVMMREGVMKGIMKTANKSLLRHFQLCLPD